VFAGLLSDADKVLTELSEAERRSLCKLRPHTLNESIPPGHEMKLVRLRLVERRLGGLTLTSVGELAADQWLVSSARTLLMTSSARTPVVHDITQARRKG
jgi:hypothetical protein